MLKETLSKFFKVDSLIDNLTGFVETRVELFKVELKEEVSSGLAKSAAWALIALVVILFVVFLSIGFAFMIAEALGMVAGFMIIAAAYFATGLILFLSRGWIISKLEHNFLELFRKEKK